MERGRHHHPKLLEKLTIEVYLVRKSHEFENSYLLNKHILFSNELELFSRCGLKMYARISCL